jgi:outer membrane receptor protein involved in Fe transport
LYFNRGKQSINQTFIMIRKLLLLLFCAVNFSVLAQSKLSGLVFDEYLEPFPGATIKSSEGATVTSNIDGEFTIDIKKFPVTLNVTSVGYQSEVVEVSSADDDLNVILKEAFVLDQVVISASRTPERVMESPVTIERIDEKYIKRTASPNFYESLGNLKGIDVLGNSFSTKIITSNRGFGNTLNNRFVQLVDGAESSIPVFEYSFGNLFGLNELDVKNVEILPGAASALYGANAFNGILLMTSKSPFDETGVSTYVKTGVTTQDDRGAFAFFDVGARMAHKFSDSFALKANIVYKQGEDWHAKDYRNSTGQGGTIKDGLSHSDDVGYDGVNVYGDEIGFNLRDIVRSLESRGELLPNGQPIPAGSWLNVENVNVSRIGYEENLINDYRTKFLTFDAALHFRPWGKDATEFIASSKFHVSDNVIHASNRYDQRQGFMQQFKVEAKGKNYFVRGYYTENDAGETTDSRLAGIYIVNDWKDHATYFGQYGSVYVFNRQNGASVEESHRRAREVAETGRFEPGTPEYQASLNAAKRTTISSGGARLIDNTGYYHLDANLNLADYIDFANIQVGGSFRSFALDSQGQVYTDDDGVIRHRLYGIYTQLQKTFDDDRLKVTATARFDKARNFEGKFSPRATVSYAVGERRDHNFRIGFQTAFRNPTSQDQYLGLELGDRVFLGTVKENLSREITTTPYRSNPTQFATLTGEDAFTNSFTAESVDSFLADVRLGNAPDTSLLVKAAPEVLRPETVQSFELGYRGALDFSGKLFEFDVVGFYNFHEDFITTKEVLTPFYGDVNNPSTPDSSPGTDASTAVQRNDMLRYILRTNTSSKIDTYGFAAGFSTKIFGGFDLGGSYTFSDFKVDSENIDFKPSFNTPKHQIKLQFGNDRLYKNFGFAVNARWQDEFLYQSRFVDALIEERLVLDAQVSLGIPSLKSRIKLGGTNLMGDDYTTVPGTGTIGAQYYISWIINN